MKMLQMLPSTSVARTRLTLIVYHASIELFSACSMQVDKEEFVKAVRQIGSRDRAINLMQSFDSMLVVVVAHLL